MNKGELTSFLTDLGYDKSSRESTTVLAAADENYDGKLNFAEFYERFTNSPLPSWYTGRYANQSKHDKKPSYGYINIITPTPAPLPVPLPAPTHHETPQQVIKLWELIEQVKNESNLTE